MLTICPPMYQRAIIKTQSLERGNSGLILFDLPAGRIAFFIPGSNRQSMANASTQSLKGVAIGLCLCKVGVQLTVVLREADGGSQLVGWLACWTMSPRVSCLSAGVC